MRERTDSSHDPVERALRYLDGADTEDELRSFAVASGAGDACAVLAEVAWHAELARQLADSQPAATGDARRRRRAAWAVAAVLLVGVVIWGSFAWRGASLAEAELVHVIGAEWAGGAPRAGSDLAGSRWQLESGLAKVRFRTGATVTIEGPADFEVAEDGARIHSGTLAAEVPETAGAFRVDTPSLRARERDGAYGVSVRASGETALCVFEGEVDVETRGAATPARASRRLREGRAVRAEPGRDALIETPYDVGPWHRAWPLQSGVLRTDGMVRFAPPGPPDALAELADDDHLLVLPEREGFVVRRPMRVNIQEPGSYAGRGVQRASVLRAGGRVRTYLIQFKAETTAPRETRRMVGTVTFEEPILGVITHSRLLQATDRILGGHPDPFVTSGRGLEPGGPRERDMVTLSADRRTLSLDLNVRGSRVDQLRVLVEAPRRSARAID